MRQSWLFAFALSLMTIYGYSAQAAQGNGFSFSFNIGQTVADQEDLNTLQSRANTRESGISASQLGNAYEFSGYLAYRLSGSFLELQFRPSYFFQSEDGTGPGGTYEYAVNGFTIFPVARFYMLEDTAIKFFSQVGIGVGVGTGEIQEGTASVDFSGAQMGYMAGLGAQFCFFGGTHCMNLEGNFRYLSIDRVIADSAQGTFDSSGSSPSLSQATSGQEVELDGRDLSISMSGFQFLIGYAYFF